MNIGRRLPCRLSAYEDIRPNIFFSTFGLQTGLTAELRAPRALAFPHWAWSFCKNLSNIRLARIVLAEHSFDILYRIYLPHLRELTLIGVLVSCEAQWGGQPLRWSSIWTSAMHTMPNLTRVDTEFCGYARQDDNTVLIAHNMHPDILHEDTSALDLLRETIATRGSG
jgi:hypothetical protein